MEQLTTLPSSMSPNAHGKGKKCENRWKKRHNSKIAKNQPIPEPIPYTNESPKVGISRDCMNNDPPKIAQFTAINGKKIPSELYKAGANFSTIISTNCTMVAIVAINMINDKKLKS